MNRDLITYVDVIAAVKAESRLRFVQARFFFNGQNYGMMLYLRIFHGIESKIVDTVDEISREK